MILGVVTGSITSTINHRFYDNRKLLIVDKTDPQFRPTGSYVICIDAVDAGIGQRVLVLDEGQHPAGGRVAGGLVAGDDDDQAPGHHVHGRQLLAVSIVRLAVVLILFAAQIVLAKHQDVLMIPVSAVVTTEDGDFCWIKTASEVERRSLKLGDTNEVFIAVQDGLKEGDEVVLNPQAYVDETRDGG